MKNETLLVNDIMETLRMLHAFDSYEESEVESVRVCITHTVNNHDRNDLSAILETLQEYENNEMLSGTDRALYYNTIARLKTLIKTTTGYRISMEDAISALSWIRQKLSSHEYIGELNDYAWYTALTSIDTAIEMFEENPEESFD